jgi:hypothetical protein
LYGKGISDSSAQIYNLNGDKIFTYKIQPFADVDAIQFANLDQISQTNTVEPSYLINPATPGNCKYNGGTGDWDETT